MHTHRLKTKRHTSRRNKVGKFYKTGRGSRHADMYRCLLPGFEMRRSFHGGDDVLQFEVL